MRAFYSLPCTKRPFLPYIYMTTWENMTVGQFQRINAIQANADYTDIEKQCEIISVLTGLTPRQIDELALPEFTRIAKQSHDLLNVKQLPGKPQRKIKANGKQYAIQYKVSEMTHGQYVTLMHFASGNFIENMHYLMATIVKPVKWYRTQSHDPAKHADYAADMQDAPLISLYHSCVFFCKLFASSMQAMGDYFVQELVKTGMTKEEAQQQVQAFTSGMDGFITPKEFQSSMVSA